MDSNEHLNGTWVHGYHSDTNYINDKSLEGEFLIDEDTICQYTGLTDKNGKKIWEGDIIKYHFGEVYAPVKFGEYQSCFDSAPTIHVGFYVDWDENRDIRKDLGYWIKLVDAGGKVEREDYRLTAQFAKKLSMYERVAQLLSSVTNKIIIIIFFMFVSSL